jgi:hypothetical protein
MNVRANRLLLTVLGLGLTVVAATATAKPPELPALRYTMYFGGFRVVDLRLQQEQDDTDYGAGLEIRTTGLADMIVRYRGKASVDGVLGQSLHPERYAFSYSSRKSRRVVEVEYDPETGDAEKVRSEKRGKRDKVDVPRELWNDVTDPLSAFLMLREHVAEWRDKGPSRFVAEVFDGRRRYMFDADVQGRTAHRRSPAIAVTATIRPRAGFDTDEMSDRERREGYRLRALFSDDERLLPLEVRTLNTSIIVTIQLAGCTGQACASAGAEGDRAAG